MDGTPFCIVERPLMIWGEDLAGDNAHFLQRVDANLYYRVAHELVANWAKRDAGTPVESAFAEADDAPQLAVLSVPVPVHSPVLAPTPTRSTVSKCNDLDDAERQERKDVSSLSRLFWYHGMETLVMMLGAYIQAPGVVHGYFLKCRTEDALEVAGCLLREEQPRYARLKGPAFTLMHLLNGIHLCAAWSDRDMINDRFARAMKSMLRDYTDEHHRAEYNSIKHGLRASHGQFGIAIGIQEAPGVPAPPEAMEMIGLSQDASFFDVAKPLRGASKQEAKLHFVTEKSSVAWSLEKVIGDLQLISILLNNVVSALRIHAGTPCSSVSFNKIADGEPFWESYFQLHAGDVPHATMFMELNARQMTLPDAKFIFDSYKKPGAK